MHNIIDLYIRARSLVFQVITIYTLGDSDCTNNFSLVFLYDGSFESI